MSTRIRYVPRPDGSKISMQVFTDKDGTDLRVIIAPDGKSGSVVFADSMVELGTFSATSPHRVKIKIKSALKKLGVKFEREKRKTDKSMGSETSEGSGS